MIPNINEHLNEINKILNPHSFVKKGKAFFRVTGDGILQVVKLEREKTIGGYSHAIRFGLFSMYGFLYPAWLSSAGSIPQYNAVNFIDKRDIDIVYQNNGIYSFSTISVPEQIEILRTYTVPFLNNVNTQNALINALQKFDTISYTEDFIEMDMHLFAPYLYIGQIDRAKALVEKYLWQHNIPIDRWSSKEEIIKAKNELLKDGQRLTTSDYQLAEKSELVKNGSSEAIGQWLQTNYENNIPLAKFCMKSCS